MVRAGAVAVTIGAVWVVARGLDGAALGAALGSARRGLLLLTSCWAVAHLCLRGLGWRVVIGPVRGGSTVKMVYYAIASAAASLLAPFRTAEMLRPWLLRRNHGVPLAQSAGVIIADKLVEALGLLLLASLIPLLGGRLPLTGQQAAIVLALATAIVLIGVFLARRFLLPAGGLGAFVAGVRIFREPARFVLALAVSLAAWLVDLAALGTTLAAFDIQARLADLIVLLLKVNVALLLPSAPGNIGSLELGATLGAESLGVGHTRAVAFAIAYHAAQLAPLVLLGALGLLRALAGGGGRRATPPNGAAPGVELP